MHEALIEASEGSARAGEEAVDEAQLALGHHLVVEHEIAERRGMSAEEIYAYIRNRGSLCGTAAAIEETIEQFIAAGCGGFMIFCNAVPSAHALEQLAAVPSVGHAIGRSLSGENR